MDIKSMSEKLADFSLVVSVDDNEYCYTESGVKPLLARLATKDGLCNAFVADRVVGKAAAFLMVFGGVKEVYTRVISQHAMKVFNDYGIPFTADATVDYIINRKGDGMCPMELACLNVGAPEEAYSVLLEKTKAISKID